MTVEDLAREMNEIIDEVAAILRIGRGHCRILLHKFNWNKESLLERYYENPDTDAFLRKAQVLPRKPAPPPLSSVGECDICCNTAPLGGLDCHHWACSCCWQMYLNTKIMNDATSEIQCIFNGCQLLIQDEKVMQYIQSEAVRSAYQRLKINSFVEGNRLLKWCPGLDCGKALKVEVGYSEPRPVVCSCSMRFCFGCAHEWHEPVNCRLLKLWLKKCSDDSETSNWINANTKECPKCQVTIEKMADAITWCAKTPAVAWSSAGFASARGNRMAAAGTIVIDMMIHARNKPEMLKSSPVRIFNVTCIITTGS